MNLRRSQQYKVVYRPDGFSNDKDWPTYDIFDNRSKAEKAKKELIKDGVQAKIEIVRD